MLRHLRRLAHAGPALAVLSALLLTLALLFAHVAPAAYADVEWRYDDGVQLASADRLQDQPVQLALDFFTDPPPAVWASDTIPVPVCTQQASRPAHVTAEAFRDAVTSASTMWSGVGAGIGIAYEGDCDPQRRWAPGNGVIEVAFDDFRNVVRGQSAAVATGTWTTVEGVKEFVEFDVILEPRLQVPPQCFESVIAHELGHVLGLGHSDDRDDLMFPSFNPADLDTCPLEPRDVEVEALQELYGENAAPLLEMPETLLVEPDALASIRAVAVDPEGQELTFLWEQLDGVAVDIEADGPTLTFEVPDLPGRELTFLVTVTDVIGAATSAEVVLTIDDSEAPPDGMPQLVAIRAASDGGDAVLEWSLPDDASALELCDIDLEDCLRATDGLQAIDWETTPALAGSAGAREVFTGDARPTSAAACNAAGCAAAAEGPLAGGLRWEPWEIDFDYIAMAVDAPGLRVSVVGVVNLSEESRDFSLYSGDASNPLDTRIVRCGLLEAGESCFAVLGPNDAGHGPLLTVVSSRTGTPTTEHRIEVR